MSLSMEKTDMFLFSGRQARSLLHSLDIRTIKDDETKENIILGDKGQQARCESCKKLITIENLGHIAKGSKKLYCENPTCFTHFIANKKIR